MTTEGQDSDSGPWQTQRMRKGPRGRKPLCERRDFFPPRRGRGRHPYSRPSGYSNWRGESDKPRMKYIGRELTTEQKLALKDLPPCPFESNPLFETLTCLDLDCWNSKLYRHRRQRPEECKYGGGCRSYRCMRLHPMKAWKKNLEEVKRQAQLRYRDKEEEKQEEWQAAGTGPKQEDQDVEMTVSEVPNETADSWT